MKNHPFLRPWLGPVLTLGLMAAAQAQDSGSNGGPGGHGRPPGPPPEAVAACKGQAEGATVSFALRDGKTVKGVCRTVNGQMAAMPPDMGNGPGKPGGSGQ
jgi:hypothetical protein